MSENERLENLLLSISYDATSVSYTESCGNGRALGGSYGDADGIGQHLLTVFTPKIAALLEAGRCGIVIESSSAETKGKTPHLDIYSIYSDSPYAPHLIYDGIRKLGSNLPHEWIRSAFEDVRRPIKTAGSLEEAMTGKSAATSGDKPVLGDKVHLFTERGKVFRRPAFADVAVAEFTPSLPDIPARISALKAVFSLATGQYDDVTEADIQAATVAGFANPEVLRGLKHATWLMTEAHRDEAWHKGFDQGYEAKAAAVDDEKELAFEAILEAEKGRAEAKGFDAYMAGYDNGLRHGKDMRGDAEAVRDQINGDLDKWMKMLGAGIMGHQPEAYTVMDSAIEELVARRAESRAARDYTMVSVPNTEPPTDLPIDEYKAEMRSLHLRQQRAETLRSELKAGQLIEDIGEPWVNDYLFSARNWGGPNQKLDSAE